MKDALKRAAQAIGLAPATPVAEVVSEATQAVATAVDAETGAVVEMVTHTFEAPADAASYHAVVTELTLATSKLGETSTELATALANLATVTSELEAMKAAKAKAEADALAAKMAQRKAAIVEALGTERADAFMVATEAMPDAQFETVMAAMNASVVAEASKPEFSEVGVDAQADLEALQAEAASNGTLAILQAKYQQTAAN